MKKLAPLLSLLFIGVALTTAKADNDFLAALARFDAEISFVKEKLTKDPKSFLAAIELGQTYHSRARLTGSLADYRSAEQAFRLSLSIVSDHNTEAQIGLAAALASPATNR